MGEHAIEFLQVPAQLVGHAFEGMVQSPGPSLLALSVLFLLVLTVLPRAAANASGEATLSTPPTFGEAGSDAALAKVVESSRGFGSETGAGAVLGVSTPGGGE